MVTHKATHTHTRARTWNHFSKKDVPEYEYFDAKDNEPGKGQQRYTTRASMIVQVLLYDTTDKYGTSLVQQNHP